VIHAVRKNNERFAALLLFHQLVRRQIHRVVQQCAASAVAMRAATATTSAATAVGIAAARRTSSARLRELWPTQLIERRFQLLPRRSQILQQLHLVVEVNHESLVLIFAQQVIEESVAGVALLVQDAALAHAGIHQQPQSKRKVGIRREVTDCLRMAVLLQRKIIFGQVADQRAMFIAHRGKHGHHLHIHRNGRTLLLAQQRRSCEQQESCTKKQS
jgi:hypothetical protein